ncbi:MAG: protease pro-enzyme activation domain-containing protein, partial [Limisphaerales bacterium]
MKKISFMSNLIGKILLMVSLTLVLSGVLISSGRAAAPGLATLQGHIPAAVLQLQANGNLPATTNLNLAIGLPLRNKEALTNLLQQIYDPASTNYHHYLSPEEFTARFGPTEQDYQKVINFAQANGLSVIGTHPNRVVLDVRGKVSDIESAFHTTLRTYADPQGARNFFAPSVEPNVDPGLPILHISGLDNYSILRPKHQVLPIHQTAGITPAIGSGVGGSYQGSDFRSAYVPGTALTGAGQNVGLLQFDGFFASDITAYANLIGLTNIPNIVVIPIDGGVPNPNPFSDGVMEVSLDIEMVLSMSPGVSNIYVYEAPNPSPWVDLLNRMANDNLAKQLSCSWGGGPPDAVAEQIFQQMALQGQTFFNASGDFNAFNNSSNPIEFPSDSPHITEVGGTTLTTGAGAGYAFETVWNRGLQPNGRYAGSSGGISTFYSIPSWQANISVTANKGSKTMRNIPDVALTGDNVWVIYGNGRAGVVGGTSCAAPLWAGFTALVNQQAKINGRPSVGFLNPAIYAIASTTNYANCFYDVTIGNNTNSDSANLFFAVTNYDLCTGLGTPKGTNLINALVSVIGDFPVRFSPPPPPYGSTLAALNGGNPNGTWMLFVQDDSSLDAGVISNGWVLTLTTANPVGTAAGLALSMTASPLNVAVGQNVTYVIGVTNCGPSVSSNVTVLDTLPSNITVVSTNLTQGSINSSGFDLTWNVGALAINTGAQLTLTVQANSVGTIYNFASVSAVTPDPNS